MGDPVSLVAGEFVVAAALLAGAEEFAADLGELLLSHVPFSFEAEQQLLDGQRLAARRAVLGFAAPGVFLPQSVEPDAPAHGVGDGLGLETA